MGGLRSAEHKRVDLALRLPQLQGLVKRDPDAYHEEFLQQYRNYQAELDIFQLSPDKDGDRFGELVTFVSHTAPCYKEECAAFPSQLCGLLDAHAAALAPLLRTKIVQALVLSRNRGMLDPLALLRLFFGLFRCQDKALRQMLYDYIVSDVRNVNRSGRDDKLNKALQCYMYQMVGDASSDVAAKKSLDVMVELYRRRVWTEARTVNAIASALSSSRTRLACTALHFFLNIDVQMADDDEEEDADAAAAANGGKKPGSGGGPNNAAGLNLHQHSKKTRSRVRDARKKIKARKAAASGVKGEKEREGLFPAVMLLHDPQGTAEVVFRRLRKSNERFEVKLLMMNFISRVVGAHQLLLLPLYAHLQRYLASHQKEVTKILAYVVQACHEHVPPDELLPLLRAVSHNFITERCPGEVVAVGINAVREMIRRVPALLWEPDAQPLIVELAGMTKSRDKSVVVAARGVLNTVRELYPALLRGKDRGKSHDAKAQPARFGESRPAEGVDGAELLQAYEEGRLRLQEEESDDESGSEEGEGGEDSGWEDVQEEEEEEGEDGVEEAEESGSDAGDADAAAASDGEAAAASDGEAAAASDSEKADAGESAAANEAGSGKSKRRRAAKEPLVADSEGEEEEEEVEEEAEEGDDEDEAGPPELLPLEDVPAAEAAAAAGAADAADADAEKTAASRKGKRPDMMRVLTAEDFALIKKLKAEAAQDARDPRSRKRKRDSTGAIVADATFRGSRRAADSDGEDEAEGTGGEAFAVQPEALEGYKKRRRATLEERLESVLRGRQKFEQSGHAGGLTNLEKQRKKNFLMVRKGQGVRNKAQGKQARARGSIGKNKGGAGTRQVLKRDKRKKRRV